MLEPSLAVIGIAHWLIHCIIATVSSTTDLPPALGPLMITNLFSLEIVKFNGTIFLLCSLSMLYK
ncbi:MAG: hypothetical protein BWX61_01130 [Bacteroidetes bacterium ADurb.Bin035]|nr:MAG: hypothetical protein BWX61_01130 [Bacteroidetes bacterium ADurb.Bin035]